MDDPEEEGVPELLYQRTFALSQDGQEEQALDGVDGRQDAEEGAAARADGHRVERREVARRRDEPRDPEHGLPDRVDPFALLLVRHDVPASRGGWSRDPVDG